MAAKQKNAVVVASYASALLDYLRLRGIEPHELYSGDQLATIEQLDKQGQISVADWLSMFEIAQAALDEPDLALKAGSSINLKHLGVLGRVLMSCHTMAEASTQLARYIRLLGEFGMPGMEIHGDKAHFTHTWPHDIQPPPAVVQFMLAARMTLARWFSGRTDLQWDAYFSFERPQDISTYQQIFGGDIHFDQDANRIVMPAQHLQLPFVSADEAVRLKAALEADAILDQLSDETALIQQIRKLLIDNLELGQASLENTACLLGISARTLQRKLKDESASFRQILDDVRLARARQYLLDPQLQLAEIAFLLGYSEQSAFQYAFKQWTHLTPGEFREQAADRSVA